MVAGLGGGTGRAIGAAALFAGALLTLAAAAEEARPEPGDIRSLRPGLELSELPAEGYFMHACGSNGGPPLQPIEGWAGYKACAPDSQGLREVYVEYDDELAVMLRGNPDIDPRDTTLYKYAGTKIAGHPVILSLLLDEAGVTQAVRAVTDPRAELEDRRRAYFLRNAVKNRYGPSGWDCTQGRIEAGEAPVGEVFIKERCEKTVLSARRIVLETRLYRRPGQLGVDAAGNFVPGEFISSARIESWALPYVPQ